MFVLMTDDAASGLLSSRIRGFSYVYVLPPLVFPFPFNDIPLVFIWTAMSTLKFVAFIA